MIVVVVVVVEGFNLYDSYRSSAEVVIKVEDES